MGWYLVVRKELVDDPKLIQWADRIMQGEPDVLGPGTSVDPMKRLLLRHALLGKIVTLWRYADRYIQSDDALPVTLAGVTEIMGVTLTWLQLMPKQWLILDGAGRVILPKYCQENRIQGADLRTAKQADISQDAREKARLRQQKRRDKIRASSRSVTRDASRSVTPQSHAASPPHRDHNRTPEPVMALLASAQGHLAEPKTPESDPERPPKPNGKHPPPPSQTKTPEQLATDARKLAATGLTTTEVARMLAQYGVTPEQTAAWLSLPASKPAVTT